MDELNVLDADLPTMVVRCNNTLVLRSVITGQHIEVMGSVPCWRDRPIPVEVRQRNELIEREFTKALEAVISLIPNELQQKKMTAKRVASAAAVAAAAAAKTECNNNADRCVVQLPPCKVQRNYSCSHCSFYTQNPRSHLLHQRDVHGVRLSIHTCQHCQYASRYCQKLKRHVKMVHSGEGLQDPVIKIEKPNVPFANYGENILKPNELTKTKSESAPRPMMKPPTEIKMETAECSKNLIISQPVKNIQSDPEAFFVSAYKNQLKQFEKDHQLKNLNNSNTRQLHQISPQVSKQPKEALTPLPNNQASTNNDKPLNLSEGQATIINGEYDKKHLYGCRKCNYVTHIKSRYNKHVKYHSMPMIQCNICEFRTTYKWNLTRHLRNHHGNGIYKCSICSFSANMKQSLSSHELNHHSPPIGSAARNKTTRKRRCRVGGSDLQAECNSGPIMENNITNCIKNLGTEKTNTLSSYTKPESYRSEENNVAVDLSFSNNKNNSSSNENDLSILQRSLPYPNNMDTSDIESSNPASSECSDVETSDIDSSNSSSGLQNPIIAPPLHIDADYLNDDLNTTRNECNNKLTPLSTITTKNTATIATTSMQGMDLTKKFNNFDRSSSSGTMSADESSHRNYGNLSSSSSQSSKPSKKDINSYSISPSLSAPLSYRLCEWTSDDTFSDSSQEYGNDMEVV